MTGVLSLVSYTSCEGVYDLPYRIELYQVAYYKDVYPD